MSNIITRDHPMDSSLAGFHRPEPYPVPVNLPPAPCKGMLLSDAYAGKDSELTAITQYIVHHETCGENEQAGKTLQCLAMVEMHHLDMLGSCMRQLGASLELKSGCQHPPYWCSRNVTYGKTLRERIQINILGERAGIAGYRRILCQIRDEAIGALLERIITDEELHIEILNRMLG